MSLVPSLPSLPSLPYGLARPFLFGLDPEVVQPERLSQIRHFFEHYKDLEPGKWVKVAGWLGPEEARAEIVASVARYREAKPKPMF